jgi:hypothetical protein
VGERAPAGVKILSFLSGLQPRPLPYSGFVTQTSIVQGRAIGATELAEVGNLLASHPDWSRRRLSQELATLWNWRNGAGQLKDMAARSLLLKLEERGWIDLPLRRRAPVNRMRHKRLPPSGLAAPQAPVNEPLERLLPLVISECSRAEGVAGQRALFDALLHEHHYLGHRGSVGENLQYLVGDAQGHPLACVLFGAAAWQCAARESYLGWDASARAQHLQFIANNTRFMIVPKVLTYYDTSSVLGCQSNSDCGSAGGTEEPAWTFATTA